MQIESYRTRLEEFEQNLNRELYQYYSGLKDRLDLMVVYQEYSDLFSNESIREVKSELEKTGESFSSRRKSLKKIHDFLVDQHLDFRAARLTQEIARVDSQQKFQWEGKEIGLSQVPSLLKNEPDAASRRQLSDRFARILKDSEELRYERIKLQHSAAKALGFKNYGEASEAISGIDYQQLLDSFDAVLFRMDDSYLERLRASIESTLRLPLAEAGSWDVARWKKQNDRENVFVEKNLLPTVEATVSELGIEPERPGAVTLDLDRRPMKHSGPFCIPIRVPHEIKIVMSPGNGSGCYSALLHETGHAYHFAWTSASLPIEHRIWGDRALSESYAFLFEHFLLERSWLVRRLSFSRTEEYLRFQFLLRVFLVRRCAGKLRFALRLHGEESFDNISQIYAETMKAYTGLNHPPESWLADLANGFDAADYLRGWILESMLREYLETRFERVWTQNRSAIGFLKEIWETGYLYSADELCREIGIGKIEPQILADELAGGLQY
jgi:oligoendopeptidase F